MVTHVNRDATELWQEWVRREQENGEIPLPAVDFITFPETGKAAISVIDPSIIPGCVTFFVNVEQMRHDDKVQLEVLLQILGLVATVIGVEGRLRFVTHAGGLDYDITGDNTVALADMNAEIRQLVWVLLRDIALMGQKYPDSEASLPKSPR